MSMNNKRIALIPGRLDSKRLPNKLIKKLGGLSVIEHVIQRTKIAGCYDEIVVVSADSEILKIADRLHVRSFKSTLNHKNGTSRIAEAISTMTSDDYHFFLIQGDEALIKPRDLIAFTLEGSQKLNKYNYVNAISRCEIGDLDDVSIVKCIVGIDGRIISCFRGNPFIGQNARINTFRVNGLMAFKGEYFRLIEGSKPHNPIAIEEHIEQMEAIENNRKIATVLLDAQPRSVNTYEDYEWVKKEIEKDEQQMIVSEYV